MNKTFFQAGFTMVEVMIAAAMLAALSYFGITMLSNQTRSVAKNSFDSDLLLITNEINGILSNPQKCLNTLATTASPLHINNKFFVKSNPSAPSNGYGNANISISSYSFSGAAPDGVLTILYNNKTLTKGSTGPSTIPKRIQITFAGTPGAVTSCRAKSSGYNDIWLKNTGAFSDDIYYTAGNVAIGKVNDRAVKLDVDGTLALKSFNQGDPCDTKGVMASDVTTGKTIYCDGLNWKVSGSDVGSNIIITGPVSACRARSTATCPAGYYVISGGYKFQNSCGCGEEHRFATENFPTGNSWVATIECARAIAYAVCIKE